MDGGGQGRQGPVLPSKSYGFSKERGSRALARTLDRMKIYMDRKGPGDPGDKLSVKIKLLRQKTIYLRFNIL